MKTKRKKINEVNTFGLPKQEADDFQKSLEMVRKFPIKSKHSIQHPPQWQLSR